MKLILLTSVICLVMAAGAFGQAKKMPCGLTVADSPTLRGLRLDESMKDLITQFPRLQTAFKEARAKTSRDTDQGHVTVSWRDLFTAGEAIPAPYKDAAFTLIFLDETLLGFYVEYGDYEPDNIDAFIDQVNKTTKLPRLGWTKKDTENATLQCKGFEARLWTGRLPGDKKPSTFSAFGLYDRAAMQHQKEREALEKKHADDKVKTSQP